MTSALMEAKQKLASNFDQSISGSIDDALTRDNLRLSESKKGENYLFQRAVNCKNVIDEPVAKYIRASVAESA
jgi:hypothetical protein